MSVATTVYGGAPNRYQFQSLFDQVWATESTGIDPASCATGASVKVQATVTGVKLGDVPLGCSFSLDLQGLALDAYVSAADTVQYVFSNGTGGTIDLASGTIKAIWARPAADKFA